MDKGNDSGKIFDFSQATLGVKISIDKERIKKFDIYRSLFNFYYKTALFLSIIFIGGSWSLFYSGHWTWGLFAGIFGLCTLYYSFIFHGMITESVFESGLLIPSIIVNTNPLEIVALANIAKTEQARVQYACKKITLKELPSHNLVIGERVPCVALFGGSNKGRYSSFHPRPLSWATANIDEIQNEIKRIDLEEWNFLDQVKDKVPAVRKHEISVFDENFDFKEIL